MASWGAWAYLTKNSSPGGSVADQARQRLGQRLTGYWPCGCARKIRIADTMRMAPNPILSAPAGM